MALLLITNNVNLASAAEVLSNATASTATLPKDHRHSFTTCRKIDYRGLAAQSFDPTIVYLLRPESHTTNSSEATEGYKQECSLR